MSFPGLSCCQKNSQSFYWYDLKPLWIAYQLHQYEFSAYQLMRRNIHNIKTNLVLILYELHQGEVSGYEVLPKTNRLICTDMAPSIMNCISVIFQVVSCCERVVTKIALIWFAIPYHLNQCEFSIDPLRHQNHYRDYTKWFQTLMKNINMFFFSNYLLL